MAVQKIEPAAGLEEVPHDPRPAADVRQPADGAPRGVDEVEGSGLADCVRRIVEITLHEAGPLRQTQIGGEVARGGNGGGREVHPHDLGPALRQCQHIGAEVALQVDHAQAREIADELRQLSLFQRVQPPATGPKRGQVIAARAHVDGHALVPVGPVEVIGGVVVHVRIPVPYRCHSIAEKGGSDGPLGSRIRRFPVEGAKRFIAGPDRMHSPAATAGPGAPVRGGRDNAA